MKIISYTIIITMLGFFVMINASAVVFTNLYTFSASSITNPALAGASGGNTPEAALLWFNNTLYGTTAYGSSNNDGTVFARSDISGSFTNLHTFAGIDGANPESALILSGNTLFGTTTAGGAHGGGTIFAVNTNGTGFTTLFNFAFTNGASPQSGLLLFGGTLYGTASKGGVYGAGTIFAINTNGTGFTNIYNFNYTNGANPEGDLLLMANTLYGTTVNGGGSNGWGTVFAVNTNGSGFTKLYVFNGPNGANPQAGLVTISNILFGTTVNGGSNSDGIIFLIGTNGTGFSILHGFGSNGDGMQPYGRLLIATNVSISPYTLYGTTEQDEFGSQPIVFALNVSGSGLTNTSYSYKAITGAYRIMAGLVMDTNEVLYGTAAVNNSSPYGGEIFSDSIFSSSEIHAFGALLTSINTDGADSRAGLALSGRTLYGTASAGGTNDFGTLFAVNTDGTGFATLCDLNSANSSPWASLIVSGNTLYGTATALEDGGVGAIFSLNTDGTGFTNLSNFSGNEFPIVEPEGSLVLSGNTLYGTTALGGNGEGTVFGVNIDGTGFTNLYIFNYTTGAVPIGGLILAGNTLYGTTENGGNDGEGTVFAINTDGTAFTNFFDFSGTNGYLPAGNLVLSGNTLYGITKSDANRGCGTIFAVNTDWTGFTNLYNFSGYDGANPQANLILYGNTLYGTTSSGGGGGYGTVFSIHTDGTCFTTLYSFSGGNDGATPYDGLLLSGNTLYGTTSAGGSNGNGTVFALSLGAIPLNVQPDGSGIILTWGNPAFSLESASAVNGSYTTVSGAASPYIPAISCSQQFFRLQAP